MCLKKHGPICFFCDSWKDFEQCAKQLNWWFAVKMWLKKLLEQSLKRGLLERAHLLDTVSLNSLVFIFIISDGLRVLFELREPVIYKFAARDNSSLPEQVIKLLTRCQLQFHVWLDFTCSRGLGFFSPITGYHELSKASWAVICPKLCQLYWKRLGHFTEQLNRTLMMIDSCRLRCI